MIISILNSIIQLDEFDENSVLEAIRIYPELLDVGYWQAMDDWKNEQEGENFKRATFLLKQVSRVSRSQEQNQAFKNPFEEGMRNLSRNYINAAVDFYNNNEFPNAIKEYLNALEIDITIKDEFRVKDVLIRLLSVIPDLDLSSAHAILAKLSGKAFALEAFRSNALNNLTLELYKGILRVYMNNQPVNIPAFLILLQQVKGFAFGAMLKLPNELPDPSSYSVKLLMDIQEFEEQLLNTQEAETIPAIDEEMLMSAYLDEREEKEGNTIQTKINNLQIDFDRWLKDYMLRDIEDGNYPMLSIKELQAVLSKDTVLYIQFMAGDAYGNAANYILLISKEDTMATYAVDNNLRSGNIEISNEGVITRTSVLAFSVPDVRKEIQDTPYGYEKCTEKGIELLAKDAEMLLGPVASYLEKYRLAGKTHLMMQPHGAYHYYPFHLLPYKNGLLADEWLVTSLPNLHLLTSKKNNSTQNIDFVEMASFGLGYGEASQFNIPPLANAVTEAEKVAKLFHNEAFTDIVGNATQANFTKALKVAKRIHLCAHGIHNVSAPAFQSVFFISSKTNDGAFPAWELMDLNVENVDLLTLSACETALGRFDIMDNLQGLPAAFLKAGVSTIIGTLWEAETRSCETFFVSLYTAIKEGKSKKDAFQIAQQYTRTEHPEYRDWGNFFYLGSVD